MLRGRGVNKHPSRFQGVWLFVSPWTVAHQAPLSMGFSRQEYWSALPGPPPGDLPDPGIEPVSPALAGGFFTTSATWEAHVLYQSSSKRISWTSVTGELLNNANPPVPFQTYRISASKGIWQPGLSTSHTGNGPTCPGEPLLSMLTHQNGANWCKNPKAETLLTLVWLGLERCLCNFKIRGLGSLKKKKKEIFCCWKRNKGAFWRGWFWGWVPLYCWGIWRKAQGQDLSYFLQSLWVPTGTSFSNLGKCISPSDRRYGPWVMTLRVEIISEGGEDCLQSLLPGIAKLEVSASERGDDQSSIWARLIRRIAVCCLVSKLCLTLWSHGL